MTSDEQESILRDANFSRHENLRGIRLWMGVIDQVSVVVAVCRSGNPIFHFAFDTCEELDDHHDIIRFMDKFRNEENNV